MSSLSMTDGHLEEIGTKGIHSHWAIMVDVAFLGLNDVGEQLYDWLDGREDASIVTLIETKAELEQLTDQEPDLVLSAGYRHIVPDEYLDVPPLGAVNLHKSYLPYNRGANPNVWSIVEDNPAGVSIHYMTADVDAGPIIDRRRVPIEPEDTGRDLYDRLERAQIQQFKDVWPEIRDGTADTIEQDPDEGTYHRKSDFVSLWELDPDETVRIGEFIDRLRALTFPPYKNAYFTEDGEKYHVEIDITSEETDEEDVDRNLPTYEESEYSE
jgi:methionyl-tRNA formyltransferase